jgi:hypothetical protein
VIQPGSPCPATRATGDLANVVSAGFVGTAWGQGPAYPGGLDRGEGRPILSYLDPIPPASGFYGSEWFGQKVLWIVARTYSGPVLIRGRQLDGPNELRFDEGLRPPREMRIPRSARPEPRGRPSYTRCGLPAATPIRSMASASAA